MYIVFMMRSVKSSDTSSWATSYDSYEDHQNRSKRRVNLNKIYNKVNRMEGEYVHMLGVSRIPHDVSEMLIICSFL